MVLLLSGLGGALPTRIKKLVTITFGLLSAPVQRYILEVEKILYKNCLPCRSLCCIVTCVCSGTCCLLESCLATSCRFRLLGRIQKAVSPDLLLLVLIVSWQNFTMSCCVSEITNKLNSHFPEVSGILFPRVLS